VPKATLFASALLFALNTLGSAGDIVGKKADVLQAVKAFDKSIKEDAFVYKMAALSSENSCLSPVVYLTGGSGYCGTGGCTLLMFGCAKEGYRLLGATSVAFPPVYVAKSSTKGYHGMKVALKDGTLVVLKFDGKKYFSNASVAPKHRTIRF